MNNRRPWSAIATGLGLLAFRLALFYWRPHQRTDFDQLWHAAVALRRGLNPYEAFTHGFDWPWPLYYPLPSVLLALPFTSLPLWIARPVFDVLVAWAFTWAMWRRGTFALWACASGALLNAVANGQTTPLLVAAATIPALGWFLSVKPNDGVALFAGWPSWRLAAQGATLVVLSLLIMPNWPLEWWAAIHRENEHLVPAVWRPAGAVLLLAALRWRLPEGRLLLALAIIPQNPLPYEAVALALIPRSRLQMALYILGTWITAMQLAIAMGSTAASDVARLSEATWPYALGAVYVPMLWLVLTRPASPESEPRHAEQVSC